MLYAVISDVHSNLEALEAVLADIEDRGIGDVLFLGDAVGYGPDPNECVSKLDRTCRELVAGNHDWAVLGLTDVEGFNPYAKAAIRWTDDVLAPGARKTIGKWPLARTLKKADLLLVHASPEEPGDWHYLFQPGQAAGAFGHFGNRICLVGHSHVPFMAELAPSGEVLPSQSGEGFRDGSRYIINAGSVGQPRDGDPRACYAVLSDAGASFVRVEYPVARTQEKMRRASLPDMLVERLAQGR